MYQVSSIKYLSKIISFAGLLVILCTLYFVLYTSRIHAQESQRTITIVPPTVEQSFDPGNKAEGIMKVINDSDEELTFTVSTQDFIVVDKVGTPNILPPGTLDSKYSASSWVGIAPDSFTIKPHERQQLSYYIQIPSDARPGGHYAAVTFTPLNKPGVLGTGSSVTTQLGTLFYITVNGEVKQGARVSVFSAPFFQEYGPVKVQTEIANESDLHIRPAGTITLTNMLGGKEAVKFGEANIFPGSTREYQNMLGEKVMIGRYEAKLLAYYGKNNNLPLMATVSFIVFPWKVAIIIILLIAVIILGIMYRKKQQAPKEPQQPSAPNQPQTTV